MERVHSEFVESTVDDLEYLLTHCSLVLLNSHSWYYWDFFIDGNDNKNDFCLEYCLFAPL